MDVRPNFESTDRNPIISLMLYSNDSKLKTDLFMKETKQLIILLIMLFYIQIIINLRLMSESIKKELAISIDFGSSFSSAAVFTNEKIEIIPNEEGDLLTHSYVAFNETDILIGDAAYKQAYRNPLNTIYNFKNMMGKKFSDPLIQMEIKHLPYKVEAGPNDSPLIVVTYQKQVRRYYPHEIASIIMKHLKDNAQRFTGQTIQKTVLLAPSCFNRSQIQAMKDAAKIAGLCVLRVIHSPSAVAYLQACKKISKNLLVIDIGASKMDISVMVADKEVSEIKYISGNDISGERITNKILQFCVAQFHNKSSIDLRSNPRSMRRLTNEVETAKINLSFESQVTIEVDSIVNSEDFSLTLTREKLQQLCFNQFHKILLPIERALHQSSLNKGQIDDVILIGGSTRIPKIRDILKELFSGRQTNRSLNAQQAAVSGGALCAAMCIGYKSRQTDSILVIQVCSHSLGFQNKYGEMNLMVHKNTTIPTKKSQIFTTETDHQSKFTIKIYQIDQLAGSKIYLGQLTLNDITPASKGVPEIEVIFQIHQNTTLIVSLIQKGKLNHCQIIIYNERENQKIEELIYETQNQCKHSFEKYFIQVKQTYEKTINQTDLWLKEHPKLSAVEYESKLKHLHRLFNHFLVHAKENKETL